MTPWPSPDAHGQLDKANQITALAATVAIEDILAAFKTLERTVALAQMMCFTHIFTDGTPENCTGFEPLSSWPGMAAQNGGHYLYALDNMRIHAAPVLQPGLEAMVNLNDVKSPHPNIARMLARVGSFRSFTLAGVEAITGRPFTGNHYAV